MSNPKNQNEKSMLEDLFGRKHDYLRLSITEKCNFRCTYCNPVDLPRGYFAGHNRMSADEIETIVSAFVKLGVKKIRLTGGEPLVRRDSGEILQRLAQFPVELAISTNGALLHRYIQILKDSHVSSVNISLDSLKRDRFYAVTGRDEFNQVTQNIEMMIDHGFCVKVNAVIMKNFNDDEILDFVRWTKTRNVQVRFIEFMPFSGNSWNREKMVPYQEMLDAVSKEMEMIKLPDSKHDTAKKFQVSGFAGTFAFITTMTQPFCGGCNRLRITADGKMKNCLFSRNETDLLTALRAGESIEELIKVCVLQKAERLGGQFTTDLNQIDSSAIDNRRMIAIGG